MTEIASPARAAAATARPRGVLFIVENLPVPFDRRVWSEAQTLRKAGYEVAVICPRGKFATEPYQFLDGVHIYRHPLPIEARGKADYLLEYASALFWEFAYSLKVLRRHGFDAIHACNPPDLIFLIGVFYKLVLGKKFVFDHHDLNPELYEAKFGRRGFFWSLLCAFERWTFAAADISIATNGSYREVAIERGGMRPERVFIVRSGPNLDRVQRRPVAPTWRNGRAHLVAYVGVIGDQEGLDLLLESVDHIVNSRGRQDVQFMVMGSGPQLQVVRDMCERMKLSDYVAFTGRVDDETLFSVLSTADVCVNPDRPNPMNDKSTMNKIMEYMALEKPIVQFDVTEGRVSAQGSSLYAANTDVRDFGDKILQLIDDPDTSLRMGKAGAKRVEDELAWRHEAPKLLAAYETLFSNL